ncbi:hypothetical protein ABZ235_07310 [Streptomyces canus]|uniref:hypothetical protein n=1 Tax=Streptomyces canus TaxID=58343 RepID=UPI0033A362F3
MRTANVRTIVIWTLVALVGAAGWSVLALVRGEDVSAAWMVAAALGSYAIGYRVRHLRRPTLSTLSEAPYVESKILARIRNGCGRNVRKEIPARASAAGDAAVDASQNRHTDMRTRSSAHLTP